MTHVIDPHWLTFFVSRRATPNAVLGAYDLMRALRDAGVAVAGGFHAPVERDCLNFLLRGRQPVMVMPARPLERFVVPAAWRQAIAERRLRLESPFPADHLGSPLANARRRNQALAERATSILIVHAHPGGSVERLGLGLLKKANKPVLTLDLPENQTLLDAGARPVDVSRVSPSLATDFVVPKAE